MQHTRADGPREDESGAVGGEDGTIVCAKGRAHGEQLLAQLHLLLQHERTQQHRDGDEVREDHHQADEIRRDGQERVVIVCGDLSHAAALERWAVRKDAGFEALGGYNKKA